MLYITYSATEVFWHSGALQIGLLLLLHTTRKTQYSNTYLMFEYSNVRIGPTAALAYTEWHKNIIIRINM